MDCLTCLSLSGVRRISPGPPIYQGTHWVVDHAYPTSHKGWLVLLPRRHIEALHELELAEFQEMAELQYRLVQVMRQDTAIQKEYMMCFAEGEGFHHVHIHLVARPHDLSPELKGPRIFGALTENGALAPEELTRFCEDFTRRLELLP